MTVDSLLISCSSPLASALIRWGKTPKYQVWIVDDRQANLDRFMKDHGSEFDIKSFRRPQEVLDALRNSEPPDALLCDIYFYEDAEKREEFENLVNMDVEQLKKSAEKFDPEHAQEGIDKAGSGSFW